MKLLVAGGRDFNDMVRMLAVLVRLRDEGHIPSDPELVCGMARGADRTAFWLWRNTLSLPVHEFPADWATYGKRAGFMRNTKMAQHADALLAFWDGESAGTKHMIAQMAATGKPVFVEKY